MWCLYEFDYKSKNSILLNKGSMRDMLSFRESYLCEKISNIVGFVDSIDKYVVCKKLNVNKNDYKHHRVYISKNNNNISKITLNQVYKDEGYLTNYYYTKKIISTYIIKDFNTVSNNSPYYRCELFAYKEAFDECLTEIITEKIKLKEI